MSLEVKHGKAAHIPESVDVDGELAEKVNDRWRAGGQREPEDEWGQHDAGKLRRESNRFQSEKLAELRVYGFRMQLLPPLVRKVVRGLDDCLHEHLRVEHPVLLGYHATHDCNHTTKDRKVEEDRAMRGNFEVNEEVWVNDGGEKKDGSKGPSHERYESAIASTNTSKDTSRRLT